MKKILIVFCLIFSLGLYLCIAPETYAVTKDPICAPGWTNPVICSLADLCCKKGGPGVTCESLPGPFVPPIPITCSMARVRWTEEQPKNYCPPDGKYYYLYDPSTKKCESLDNTPTFICFTDGTCATAIGSVPVDSLQGTITFILRLAFFASGGVILLMIISTGYTIITSAGNPEKLQAAQENIIALFSGLALIAFSIVLLQTLGADVLGIPGFR